MFPSANVKYHAQRKECLTRYIKTCKIIPKAQKQIPS